MNTIVFENSALTPSKIVCVGRNYVEHAEELGNPVPSELVFFLKPNSSITSTLLAFHQEPLHYECELCFLVMNKKLRGVGLGLDLTKRALQSQLKQASLPWERAKAFDGSALFSQFTVLDAPIETLSFELCVDGAVRQRASAKQMIFPPDSILKEVSDFMSLEDGDIIMSGTPKGVGEIKKGELFEARLYENENLLLNCSWKGV